MYNIYFASVKYIEMHRMTRDITQVTIHKKLDHVSFVIVDLNCISVSDVLEWCMMLHIRRVSFYCHINIKMDALQIPRDERIDCFVNGKQMKRSSNSMVIVNIISVDSVQVLNSLLNSVTSMQDTDKRIRKAYNDMSDPDLLYVVSDGPLYLYGYPPWLIRVTEIHHVKSDRLTRDEFMYGLHVFQGRSQRYGK
jgi:hypothetical protein